MFRLLFLIALSLGLCSQAVAAVKWNNSGGNSSSKMTEQKILNSLKEKPQIFEGYKFQIPNITDYQISDATLEYYYLMSDMLRANNKSEQYIIQPSSSPLEFLFDLEENRFVQNQLKEKAIFNYIYYENGKIIYDALPPSGRFNHTFTEASYFASHSVGKSITSYLLGHAICEGYITSIDEKITDWPLMENTLYYGQPLINLLNMKAGDTHVIKSLSGKFTKTGRGIHGNGPLLQAVRTKGELKDTKPLKNPQFAYSNLTADILFNFIMHRVGNDFDNFMANFYQNKVKVKYPIYQWMNRLTPKNKPITTKNRIAQGAGQYGISATRYDFLRIGISILNDWENNTCEGQYLREIYSRAVATNTKFSWKERFRNPERRANFFQVAKGYAGQFYVHIPELQNDTIFAMQGADGQEIVINMDKSRVVVINAGQENFYDTRKLAFEPLKYGRIRTGNWN